MGDLSRYGRSIVGARLLFEAHRGRSGSERAGVGEMWKKGWKRKNEEGAGGDGAAPSRKFAKKDSDDDGGDDGIVVCQVWTAHKP